MVLYELYEYDYVYRKKLERVSVKASLDEARNEAKKLSKGWCEDEEPKRIDLEIGELWIGECDFGILIL